MKCILAILLSLTSYSTYCQSLSQKLQIDLIRTTITDWSGPPMKDEVLVNAKIRPIRMDSLLLYIYLSKKVKHTKNRKLIIKRSEILDISNMSLPETQRVITNTEKFDSLGNIYWLVHVAVAEHFYGMSDSAKSMEMKKNMKTNYVPIELGTFYYSDNHAVISIIIGNSRSYHLYKLKNGKWTKVKNLFDPH